MSSKFPYPVELFLDIDGQPLEDGYIYIGSNNLNPEVSPITVYWDPALTIPAAQPIRTLGGFPSRSGSASNVYTSASQYSITVRNKNNTLIISSLSEKNPFVKQSVSTYTDLRALTSANLDNGELISVTDSGVLGIFVVKTGTVTDNGGTHIVFSDDSNRYAERIYSGGLNIEWFEAVGDDSTDNTIALGKAISALPASGGEVIIPEGTFIGYIDVPNNVKISGFGRSSILKIPDSALRPAIQSADTTNGNVNISLQNFSVDGNESNNDKDTHGIFADGPCNDWTLEGVYVSNTGGNGLRCRGAGDTAASTAMYRLRVTNCSFIDCGSAAGGADSRDGIYLNRVRDSVIDSNNVRNAGRQGIALEGSAVASLATRYVAITNNIIDSCVAGGIDDETDNGGDFNIDGNIIRDCAGAGVRVIGPNGITSVSNNLLFNCGSRGIDVENALAGVHQPGAYKHIIGNMISTTGAEGISLNQGHYCKISQNVIYNSTSFGIYITGDNVTGWDCSYNSVQASTEEGILVNRVNTNFKLIGNIVRSSGSAAGNRVGIVVLPPSGTTQDGIIALNRVYDDRGTQYQTYGLRLGNCNNIIVALNNFTGNLTNAIQYDSNSNGVLDIGNLIDTSTGTDGLSTDPISHVSLYSNSRFGSFADGDTTPSVKDYNLFKTGNTGSTTITNFDDPKNGETIKVVANDTNTTVANNANIKTQTGANIALTQNIMYTFTRLGGVWYQE